MEHVRHYAEEDFGVFVSEARYTPEGHFVEIGGGYNGQESSTWYQLDAAPKK